MALRSTSLTVMFILVAACSGSSAGTASKPARETPYLERLTAFRSKLIAAGPAPQEYAATTPPAGVQQVRYESDGLPLAAWLAFPPNAQAEKMPALVYFHGGFAFDASDFAVAKPFLEHGFVVMTPMLRGENGNPGTYELFLAEVRDGKAAVAWLAAHERVDPKRIYTFGHSSGGMISALLSLHDAEIRHGGSSGGLYDAGIFKEMRDIVPFALNDPAETELRVLLGNLAWMKAPHYAFVGRLDSVQAAAAAREEQARTHAPLTITSVSGDHHSALGPSIAGYLDVLQRSP